MYDNGGQDDFGDLPPFSGVFGRHHVGPSENPSQQGQMTARDKWDFGFNPGEDNSIFATDSSSGYSRDPLTNIGRHAVSSLFDPPIISQNYREGEPIPVKDLGGQGPGALKNFHFIKHRPEEYK